MKRVKGNAMLQMISVVSIICLILSLSLFVPQARAATGPKTVHGYITDQNGYPIEGANATVNIRDSGNNVRSTLWYDASDPDGYYVVTFGPSDWDIGNTIETIATYGGDSSSNTSIAIDYPVQYINVTIAILIPEFGLFGSFSVLVMSMVMVAAFMIARRKGQG